MSTDHKIIGSQLVCDSVTEGVIGTAAEGQPPRYFVFTDGSEEPVQAVGFDTTTSNPTYGEGKLFYDHTDHSLAYYNESENVTVNIGREELLRVYNNTGSVIDNGKLVYVNGAYDGWPTVTMAQADTYAKSQATIGMATESIGAGEYGYICVNGIVHDLNMSAYAAGTLLYLSATTPGGITDVMPLQPNYVVKIGTCISASATIGEVHVDIEKLPWYPSFEVRNVSSSVTLPTTPTILMLPTVAYNDGFTYDAETGILTFLSSGNYTVNLLLNAEPSASNKNIYWYAEVKVGANWVPVRYSARMLRLVNATATQMLISSTNYWPVGSQVRMYLWADATVYLKSTDLPGTTEGTVTLPAARLQLA